LHTVFLGSKQNYINPESERSVSGFPKYEAKVPTAAQLYPVKKHQAVNTVSVNTVNRG